MVYKNCGKIVVEPQIGVNFGRTIVLWLGWGIHSKANWVGVIILEKIEFVVQVVVISNDNIVLWL